MQAMNMVSSRGNVYLVKIGGKPVGDGIQEICKEKKVIWDQLLAIKAEIIRGKLYFRLACIFERSQYRFAVKVFDYILCRA